RAFTQGDQRAVEVGLAIAEVTAQADQRDGAHDGWPRAGGPAPHRGRQRFSVPIRSTASSRRGVSTVSAARTKPAGVRAKPRPGVVTTAAPSSSLAQRSDEV